MRGLLPLGRLLLKLLLPEPLLRAELITSGMQPLGGFHRTTAVIPAIVVFSLVNKGCFSIPKLMQNSFSWQE